MSNEAAFAQLDDWLERLHTLPEVLPQAMPAAAAAVAGAVREDLAAGRDPGTGELWAPRKKDGERPMQGAAGALQVIVSGTTITLELGAPYTFHHFPVRGEPARHVVPTAGVIPLKMGQAIRLGILPHWRKAVGG